MRLHCLYDWVFFLGLRKIDVRCTYHKIWHFLKDTIQGVLVFSQDLQSFPVFKIPEYVSIPLPHQNPHSL